MKKTLLFMMALLFALGLQAKNVKTVVLTTMPQMHCAACEKKIKNNLRFEKGVKSIETNVEKQTVTITYDADKTTPEKIAKGFEKFGYSARQLKNGEQVQNDEKGSCANM